MFLNKIPDKRNNRTLLVIQERYRGKDGKPHSRTVEKIGFLEDLKDKYDDPVAHFREEARRRTAEKKAAENIIAVEIQKDGLLPFDESGEYDIRMRIGNAPIAKVIHSSEGHPQPWAGWFRGLEEAPTEVPVQPDESSSSLCLPEGARSGIEDRGLEGPREVL